MGCREVKSKMGAIALCLCPVWPQISAALLFPLQETQVREAYFLGSGDREKAARFLGQYVREYPEPAKGAWVYRIDFRTPYEEIVRRSWEKTVGYSAQQAQRDYYAQPDLVIVRVLISFMPPYGSTLSPTIRNGQPVGRSEDLWRDFPVHVMQSRPIEPRTVNARPLYSRRQRGVGGAEISLEFIALQFSSEVARVEVTTPDGETVHAEFDLDRLN
ncbi:MAG TPA: hypothetical protein VHF01_02255 [Candidatus Acidoferrum sp.]|nr:hypothetical protein [Candidatus Acidoferrum sp.]